MVFYAIDKTTGVLGIFKPSPEFIESGERKVARAIEVFSKYFGEAPTDNIDNYFIDEFLM